MSQQESPMSREAALRWAKRRSMGEMRFISLYAFLLLGGPVFCFHVGKQFFAIAGASPIDVVTWPLAAAVTGGIFGRWLWRFNEAAYTLWCETHGEPDVQS